MDRVDLFQCAKVNLTLGINGIKDGYHLLESIMVPIDLYDEISIKKRNDDLVEVRYLTGEKYANDNALKVALAIKEAYGLGGMDISISKGVPGGVGLGGSAVDGAGIAVACEKLFNLSISNEFLVALGGDIPFLKSGVSALVKGRGEEVAPISLPKLYIILVYGNTPVSTKEVFDRYDDIGGESGITGEFLNDLMPYNALEKGACELVPSIKNARTLLEEADFTRVVMTGAGSGYIAFTPSKEEFDAKKERAMALARDRGLKAKIVNVL